MISRLQLLLLESCPVPIVEEVAFGKRRACAPGQEGPPGHPVLACHARGPALSVRLHASM